MLSSGSVKHTPFLALQRGWGIKMKCQKCHKLFVKKGRRWCDSCGRNMSLADKIKAQQDFKDHCKKLYTEVAQ
jgi:rRNA maturation endonuclease Nob1